MGHTSPQMLFNHYRNLVLAADAERYWKINPEDVQAHILAARVGASAVQANPLEPEPNPTVEPASS